MHGPSLGDLVTRSLTDGPDRMAFRIRNVEATQHLSYRELFRRSEAFGAAYRAAGLGQGTIVLIVLDHCSDLLCAFVGAILSGAVPAVLPPPANRQDVGVFWSHMAEMARHAGSGPIVASESLQRRLPSESPLRDRVFLSPAEVTGSPAPFVRHQPDPDDTAFLQYSSGTTGLRKGVKITHRMFGLQVDAYRYALGLTDTDRVVSWLPLYHDMGLVACFLETLATGISTTLIDPFFWVRHPHVLFEEIEAARATHVWMPNFAFNHLAGTVDRSKAYDLSSIKAFVNCSEACKVETFDRFLNAFGTWGVSRTKLQTCYAMAESVFAVTQTDPHESVRALAVSALGLERGHAAPPAGDETAVRIPSVGRPLRGLDVRVVDETGAACGDRTLGEIEVRGPMVTSGYVGNAEASAEARHGAWWRTGDLGFRCEGELYVTGRKKDVLIVHGRNYYAHDVEAVVSQFTEIRPGRVCAFGRADDETGSEDLIIVAECRSPAVSEYALRRAIKAAVVEALGVTVATVTFVPRGSVVKTTSGKVDRENNRRKFSA